MRKLAKARKAAAIAAAAAANCADLTLAEDNVNSGVGATDATLIDPEDLELLFPEIIPEEYMIGAECETIDKVQPILRANG